MFENQKQEHGIEDMFAEIDGGNPEQDLQSRQANIANSSPTQPQQAPQSSANQFKQIEEKAKYNKNDVKYLIIGIVSLMVVLIVAWIVYQTVLKPKYINKETLTVTEETDNTYNDLTNNLETNSSTVTPPADLSTPNSVEPSATTNLDTDGDGLSDVEEKKIGTDINKIDTDGDGLSDKEEVEIWKTNPLDPDTDGDGYPDGKEVEGKYNPNGPGRLYEVKEIK